MNKLPPARVATPGRIPDAEVVAVGIAPIEIHAEPDGPTTDNQCSARVRIAFGGHPVHVARTAVANGLRAAVIAPQGAGWPAALCHAERISMLLQKRQGPALSVIVPNGQPGLKDVYTQQVRPPTAAELTPDMERTLGMARVVFVGPLPWDADTRNLLLRIPDLAPTAFRALLPHPTLLQDSSFSAVAGRYDYVQVNADEARLLDGATDDVVINACRLRFLCGERTACAVTNGAGRGYLWAEGRWLTIDPKPVGPVDDTACGDAFAASWVIGWRLLDLRIDSALHYAVEAAAAVLQVGMTEPLAYRKAAILA
jgi:sugar/nucleoside kinase (ribokinase family)